MKWSQCRFVGEHHLSSIAEELSAAILDWSDSWGGAKAQQSVGCEPARTLEPESPEYDGKWMALNSQGNVIAWVKIQRGVAAEILEYFSFPTNKSSPEAFSDLGETLGYEILLNLFERFAGISFSKDEGVHFEMDVPIPPVRRGCWSGTVLLPFSIGRMRLLCLLPYEAMARMIPKMPSRAHGPPQLERLSEAMRSARVSIDVRLSALNGLALENLDDLVEGSVIVFDRPATAIWTAYSSGDCPIAKCKVGQIDGKYAVQWSA